MVPEEPTRNVLEAIINSFQESALIADKDGIVLFANETFAKRIGKELKDIIGKSFYDLFSPEVARTRKNHIEHVIKTNKTASFEDQREGRYFIAYMSPMADAYGNVDKVLIIAHDITEKKRLENELISSKEQLMAILNSIDEIIYIGDLNTYEILFANTYTKNIFGSDIEGKLCYKVLHKLEKPCKFCTNKIILKLRGQPYRWEFYNNIIKRHFIVTNRLINWSDGRKVRFSLGIDVTRKKLAEIKLKESEEKFKGIIENLTEGFFRTTPDGRYIMANPALARLYGYSSPEELINDTKDIASQRFANKEDRKQLIEQIEKNGYVENFEVLRVRKDGTTFWGLTNARSVKDEKGNTIYYEGTLVDVTYKKLLEESLKDEMEKLSTITDHAPIGMALIDKDGRYLYVNPTFTRILGYDINDIPDRDTWFKKAYPDEAYRNMAHTSWHRELEKFKTGGQSTPTNFTVTCKDGSKKILNITAVILPTGQFIMAFEDVTERQRLEANYRALFENAIEGIAQTTLDGRFIIANPALIKMLGYNSFEDLTKNIGNVTTQLYVNPQDREKILHKLKAGHDIKGYETQLYRKDGTKIWVSQSMSGVYDEKGNILYFNVISEDITDKKKKEEELERLRQQYNHAQKMEAIGTLTGGIAHDFNNFLTAVTGYTSILKMKLANKPELQSYLDQILSVSDKMADLVKSLLAFSRKQPIKLEPVELNTEIEQSKKILKRLLTEHIHIEFVPSKKNPVIMADRTQLNQILFNLTTNARDAMPDGGTFTIETDIVLMDDEFIKTHGFGKKGDYAALSVSDTGIGIKKDIIDKIFDPFFTTKEPGKGTGLGLASVYGIVKQHDGYITVDSTPGVGTTFCIYLPLVDMKATAKGKKEEFFPSKGTGTILICEDDESVRVFLKDALEQYGYRVFVASDGEALINAFKEKADIDLIITDVIMPKKGGVEAYNEIKAIKKDTKFIFMSGYDKDMYSKIPTDDIKVKFILKPVSIDTLLKTVEEILKS